MVLGDGASWICNIADELFPGAVQIVDLFHAKQHLWDVAKVIYGPGTDMAERWAKRRRDRHRMRYPAFRARGLCVGSGVLEAGCKNVVGTRFKRPGMHWSVAGVNAMAALRCCVLSKRLDDFWIRQSALRRLAPNKFVVHPRYDVHDVPVPATSTPAQCYPAESFSAQIPKKRGQKWM